MPIEPGTPYKISEVSDSYPKRKRICSLDEEQPDKTQVFVDNYDVFSTWELHKVRGEDCYQIKLFKGNPSQYWYAERCGDDTFIVASSSRKSQWDVKKTRPDASEIYSITLHQDVRAATIKEPDHDPGHSHQPARLTVHPHPGVVGKEFEFTIEY